MHLGKFEYLEPRSIEEALVALKDYGKEATIKAGGTALIPDMRLGVKIPRYLINISSLRELDHIEIYGVGISIGALTNLYKIRTSPIIRENYPGLVEAVESVSALSMHHQSTMGGNLCQDTRCRFLNQSTTWRAQNPRCYKAGGSECLAMSGAGRCSAAYRGDIAPVLISMKASVTLKCTSGERKIPISEFFTGNGKRPNILEPDELMTEVHIPIPRPRTAVVYEKERIRTSLDYPIAGVGAMIERETSGTCSNAVIVLTALGPGPVSVPGACNELVGKVPDRNICALACEKAEGAVRPLPNMESTPDHRRELTRSLVYRALLRAFDLKGEGE